MPAKAPAKPAASVDGMEGTNVETIPQGKAPRRAGQLLTAVAAAVMLAACGGGGDTGTTETQSVNPGMADGASGEVKLCGHKDASGINRGTVAEFTKENPDIQAEYVEIGANSDQSRTQMVQRLEGQSAECDLFLMDVTWVSEFASQNWVMDQTELVSGYEEGTIPSTLETALYEDKYWAAPFYTNASLIYYMPDKVSAPESWQQLYEEAGAAPGNAFVYQAQQYEGLTVNFLELLYSAGGEVLDKDGNVTIDSPEAREVLEFMAQGLEAGAAPRSVLTYDEDATRLAFESGDYGYQRNWPHVYRLLNESALAGTFEVAPLPAFGEDGTPSGVLGGWNLAINAFSDNPEAAVALINFATNPDWQKRVAADYSQAPVSEAAYDDPAVQEKMPFAQQLRESVEGAKPRPKSPVYPQISQAIYENAYAVISGDASADEAVTRMAEQIEAAQETF